MVILFVDLEVVGEMVDARRQQGYLDLRRSGVGIVQAIISDYRCFG